MTKRLEEIHDQMAKAESEIRDSHRNQVWTYKQSWCCFKHLKQQWNQIEFSLNLDRFWSTSNQWRSSNKSTSMTIIWLNEI